MESELWLMGGAGIFNGKPRRLAVSAWDGLSGQKARLKQWEVSVTRRNANQKEKVEWILYQASPRGMRAWRCHSVSSQPFWWEAAHIVISGISLRTSDIKDLSACCWDCDILFSQVLLKNSVKSHPNFNRVECIFSLFLWNVYIHVCTTFF